jgi:CBS domain-containing protein
MKTIKVKELMVPLEAYATVSKDETLLEAILDLEKSQKSLDPTKFKHRAILVLDEDGKVISKITMKNFLIALEPNYGKVEGTGILERSGYSPELIRSMLEDHGLWLEPLQFFCERASKMKVGEFIQAPSEDEYIHSDANLGEAIQQLIVFPYHSLLVTEDDEVVGILRLSDVFTKVCSILKGGRSV